MYDWEEQRRLVTIDLSVDFGLLKTVNARKRELLRSHQDGAHQNGHHHGGQKPAETFVTKFRYKSVNFSLVERNKNTLFYYKNCSDSQIPWN